MFKGKRFLFLIAVFSAVSCFCSDGSDIVVKIAEDSIDKLKDVVAPLSPYNPITIANIVVQAAPLARDGFRYFVPTQEQKLNDKNAGEFLDIFESRVNFRKCLFSSTVDSERDILNSPAQCKELARAFIMLGGRADILEMVKNFDENWK